VGSLVGVRSTNQAKSPDCRVRPSTTKAGTRNNSRTAGTSDCRATKWRRLMQVTFAGHAYLFVNPKFAASTFRQSGQWFNYGGDKIWLLPEGNNDEQPGSETPMFWMTAPSPFERFRKGSIVNRTDRSIRSADRNSIHAHDSPRRGFSAHRISRVHENVTDTRLSGRCSRSRIRHLSPRRDGPWEAAQMIATSGRSPRRTESAAI